jgi:hypothetical protein
MIDINALIKTVPQLLDPSISIKLVEVAKKYNTEVGSIAAGMSKNITEPHQGQPITRIPEYTKPGGPNSYHCSKSQLGAFLLDLPS